MAAGAWTVYSKAVLDISNKLQNLGSDAYNIILLTNSYTPAPNTDHLYSDISTNEVANGAGYTTKGIFLTGLSNSLTTATVTFTSSNPVWSTFTSTLRYAAIIHNAAGGSAAGLVAGDLLLCYSDLTGGGSITGAGGNFTITMNGSGIFTITHSP